MGAGVGAKVALAVAATLTALVAVEAVLRSRAGDRYAVYPPGMEVVFVPDAATMPGVAGPGRFSVNALGTRGDEPPDGEALRVLAVGGSTTECMFLDDDEAWPHLLQDRLAESGPAFVGNIGRRGDDLPRHLLHLSRLLPQHPELDAVVVLAGVNDLLGRLCEEGDFRALRWGDWSVSGEDLVAAFAELPRRADPRLPALHRTLLWQRSRAAWRTAWAAPATVMDPAGSNFEVWRGFRRDATALRASLPDLGAALAEFDENLDALVAMTEQAGVRLVLATQPVMWRDDLPPDLEALLWMGGVGHFMETPGHDYYTVGALAQGMAQFNDRTRAACARHGLRCVDLAAALPADTRTFFDDCHFNEPGAVAVADAVAAAFPEVVAASASAEEGL